MFKLCFTTLLGFLFLGNAVFYAQDTTYVNSLVSELSGEGYFGRGYMKDGCTKAAARLQEEMEKVGLQPYEDSYYQHFSFWVNTFPEPMELKIDGQNFRLSHDFIIPAESDDLSGTWPLIEIDSLTLADSVAFSALKEKEFAGNVVYFNEQHLNKKRKKLVKKQFNDNSLNAKAYICIKEGYPMWNASAEKKKAPLIQFTEKAFPENPDSVSIHVNSKMRNVEVSNVIGYLPGNSDRTMAVTAHYDHLGGIGDSVYFAGANDNASGVAACLDIAAYCKKHETDFNLVVMLFAGEEAGLLGSMYCAANPLIPNEDIDFLINLDMVGTGDNGFTIVNVADDTYTEARKLFDTLNEEGDFVEDLAYRGIAANSDHYPFHAMDVQSVFFYGRGGESWYHHVNDTPETLSYAGYNGLFKLLIKFMESYGR